MLSLKSRLSISKQHQNRYLYSGGICQHIVYSMVFVIQKYTSTPHVSPRFDS